LKPDPDMVKTEALLTTILFGLKIIVGPPLALEVDDEVVVEINVLEVICVVIVVLALDVLTVVSVLVAPKKVE
jgi:hypothetical protein